MKANNLVFPLPILKALAEPSRLKLLAVISKGEICACELPPLVKKSQPVVSLHLSVLAKAGLVEVRPEGSKRFYSISSKGKRVLENILEW
jgi:ArsR family transcriptional regulator